MAKRLATEYVRACLRLSEAELVEFLQMSLENEVVYKMKVFENGNQEMVFQDGSGEEITLTFEPRSGCFVSQGSYKVNTPVLANFMRKAVSVFKGNAIVNRIYSSFTMVYYYDRGTVVKIVELSEDEQKVIYEFKNRPGELEKVFQQRRVETEIANIQRRINRLLDLRIGANELGEVGKIDSKLQTLAHRLFVLEA